MHYLHAYVHFSKNTYNEDDLNPTNPYSLLHIYHAELGVDISLDSFRLSLPSEASFPDQNDLCGELIVNGDAEVRIEDILDHMCIAF